MPISRVVIRSFEKNVIRVNVTQRDCSQIPKYFKELAKIQTGRDIMGLFSGGWRIEILGAEVKTKAPADMLEDETKKFVENVVTLGAAVLSGDGEKLKQALGGFVLDANPSTFGVRKLAETLVPQIPDDKMSEVVGAGVIAFITTQNPVLVVLAAAQEFYAEYELARETKPAGPAMGAAAPIGARAGKEYSVECLKLFSWKNPEGEMELWAGFANNPVFKANDGREFTWPYIDLRKGDTVTITASTNEFPNQPVEDGQTLPNAVGTFKFPSTDTPGLGANQITQTLVFDKVS